MTAQTPTVLKSYFETGDRPTQAQFGDLIDSMVNSTTGENGYFIPTSSSIPSGANAMYLASSNTLGFSSNGTPKLTIGTNVTVESGALLLQDGLVGSPGWAFENDSDTGMYRVGSGQIGFAANGALVNSVTTTGTSTTGTISVTDGVDTGSITNSTITLRRTSGSVVFIDSRTVGNGLNIRVSSATEVDTTAMAITSAGMVQFLAGSFSAPSMAAQGDTNTGIYFPAADTISIATGGARRLTVNSTGDFLVGTTAIPVFASGTTNGFSYAVGSTCYISAPADALRLQRTGSSGVLLRGYDGTTESGNLSVSGATISLNNACDRRLKKNIELLDVPGGMFEHLSPYRFDYINEKRGSGVGFMMQDMVVYAPEGVTPGDDAADRKEGDDGFIPWMGDQTKLIPYMWAEIQSLRARIAALEGA